ncbi:hypothetical protein [Stenotrophomonas sp. UBA7606]|uniref:hypothetical protein n=1 Tax=Stenotrophomonas sp. UBA7606 TaxID=1947559 RepID=UPI0025D60E39|nr:hypothetical protein [Stenotrophomonas sp. UBA7606]
MMHSRDHVLQRALAVLDWNRRNLNTASVLDEAAVGECFADHFVVEPNGRRYEATRATYLTFLNGMKAGMRGIDYDVLHTLVDAQSVALSILAHISHDDDRRETPRPCCSCSSTTTARSRYGMRFMSRSHRVEPGCSP